MKEKAKKATARRVPVDQAALDRAELAAKLLKGAVVRVPESGRVRLRIFAGPRDKHGLEITLSPDETHRLAGLLLGIIPGPFLYGDE